VKKEKAAARINNNISRRTQYFTKIDYNFGELWPHLLTPVFVEIAAGQDHTAASSWKVGPILIPFT
jgi:hypothetical protein